MEADPVTVRLLTHADLPAADSLFNGAYGRSSGLGQTALNDHLTWQEDGWLLAEQGQAAVGMVYAIRFDTYTYVGVMSVVPRLQRRGVGQALMSRLLADLKTQGVKTVRLDATPEGVALYKRFGFIEEGTKMLFRRVKPMRDESPVMSPVAVRPLLYKELATLNTYDLPRFGADRSRVLKTLLKRYQERAFSCWNAGRLTGYVLASPRIIGPWVADDPETAEGLLLEALKLPFDEGPTIIAPGANEEAGPLLYKHGFEAARQTLHMCWGERTAIAYDEIYAQVSFAVG